MTVSWEAACRHKSGDGPADSMEDLTPLLCHIPPSRPCRSIHVQGTDTEAVRLVGRV
jgi:hypothetical protein